MDNGKKKKEELGLEFYTQLGAIALQSIVADHVARMNYNTEKTARDESWYRALESRMICKNDDFPPPEECRPKDSPELSTLFSMLQSQVANLSKIVSELK